MVCYPNGRPNQRICSSPPLSLSLPSTSPHARLPVFLPSSALPFALLPSEPIVVSHISIVGPNRRTNRPRKRARKPDESFSDRGGRRRGKRVEIKVSDLCKYM